MAGKIIWINGAFGAGKTCLANRIAEKIPNAFRFDPELLGSLLRELSDLPQPIDFQDAVLWRRLVVSAIETVGDYTEGVVVVPMTIVNPRYYSEIIGQLANTFDVDSYFLEVPEEVLVSRISSQVLYQNDATRDVTVRSWRLDQIRRCLDGRQSLPHEVRSLDGTRNTDELVDEVIKQSDLRAK